MARQQLLRMGVMLAQMCTQFCMLVSLYMSDCGDYEDLDISQQCMFTLVSASSFSASAPDLLSVIAGRMTEAGHSSSRR
jgi:hypothetical protein